MWAHKLSGAERRNMLGAKKVGVRSPSDIVIVLNWKEDKGLNGSTG